MSKKNGIKLCNYDETFERATEFFENSKFEISDLEKFLFLIERKIEKDEEFKPRKFDVLNSIITSMTFLLAIIVFLFGKDNLNTISNLGFVMGLVLFIYSIIFFSSKANEHFEEVKMKSNLNIKKKYLIIKTSLNNEIKIRLEPKN